MKSTIKLAALAPALLLGGCLSFGGEAPDSLLTLTPTATVPAGAGAPMSQSNAIALVDPIDTCAASAALVALGEGTVSGLGDLEAKLTASGSERVAAVVEAARPWAEANGKA